MAAGASHVHAGDGQQEGSSILGGQARGTHLLISADIYKYLRTPLPSLSRPYHSFDCHCDRQPQYPRTTQAGIVVAIVVVPIVAFVVVTIVAMVVVTSVAIVVVRIVAFVVVRIVAMVVVTIVAIVVVTIVAIVVVRIVAIVVVRIVAIVVVRIVAIVVVTMAVIIFVTILNRRPLNSRPATLDPRPSSSSLGPSLLTPQL